MFFLIVTVFKDGDIDICNAHAERPGITHPPILAQFKARIDTAIRNDREGVIQMRVKSLDTPRSADIQAIQHRFGISERINRKAKTKGFHKGKSIVLFLFSSFWNRINQSQVTRVVIMGLKSPIRFSISPLPLIDSRREDGIHSHHITDRFSKAEFYNRRTPTRKFFMENPFVLILALRDKASVCIQVTAARTIRHVRFVHG